MAYGAAQISVCVLHGVLLPALVSSSERRLGEFYEQELANTTWVLATASLRDAPLFSALAFAAGWRLGDFSAQELANTAWASASASQCGPQLFLVLARAAERR